MPTFARAACVPTRIIGMPTKCVAMLRLSRWYSAYEARRSTRDFTPRAYYFRRAACGRPLGDRIAHGLPADRARSAQRTLIRSAAEPRTGVLALRYRQSRRSL